MKKKTLKIMPALLSVMLALSITVSPLYAYAGEVDNVDMEDDVGNNIDTDDTDIEGVISGSDSGGSTGGGEPAGVTSGSGIGVTGGVGSTSGGSTSGGGEWHQPETGPDSPEPDDPEEPDDPVTVAPDDDIIKTEHNNGLTITLDDTGHATVTGEMISGNTSIFKSDSAIKNQVEELYCDFIPNQNITLLCAGCSAREITFGPNFLANASSLSNMIGMFDSCTSLEYVNLSDFNTGSATIDTRSMFHACTSLRYVNLDGLSNSRIPFMSGMFSGCSALTDVDLSVLNTSGTIGMDSMFYGCTSLEFVILSGLDTSSLVDMHDMFHDCTSLKVADLHGLDTSHVKTMSGMFSGCTSFTSFNGNSLDVSNVEDFSHMFENCTSLEYGGSSWNVPKLTDVSYMFAGCSSMKSLILDWTNAGNITNVAEMLEGMDALHLLMPPKNLSVNLSLDKAMYKINSATNTVNTDKSYTGVLASDTTNNALVLVDNSDHEWNENDVCSICRVYKNCIHAVTQAAIVSETPATCTAAGIRVWISKCTGCNEELDRWTENLDPIAHDPGSPVEENRTENGYDKVVYCKRDGCHAEISRDHITLDPTDPPTTPTTPTNPTTPTEPTNPTTPTNPTEPDDKPDDKPDVKPDPKPDPKPETKPEQKPDNKPETKPDTKPETKPEQKPDPKPDNKPETKPETKPESKPAPADSVKPKPEQESTSITIPSAIAEPEDTVELEDTPEDTPEDPSTDLLTDPVPELLDTDTEDDTDEQDDIPDPRSADGDDPDGETADDEAEKNDHNVAAVAAAVAATVMISAGSAWFIVLWYRRRKICGHVSGVNAEGLYVTLTGKDSLETYTNADGAFVFKNVKEDDLLLTVYDANGSVLLRTEIYTKGKQSADAFTVIENHVSHYSVDLKGKTFTVTIKM